MGVLKSVNVGVPRENPWKAVRITGIDKRPVGGPVAVHAPGPKGTGAVGLAGDRVYDVANHGGDDQAVYAYAREELDAWEARTGRELPDGVFGENLTTTGVDVDGAVIGEHWRVGPDLLLEVSCPRIPCGTFQGWMAEAGWIAEFTEVARPGAYLRVLEPGEIRAGDQVVVTHRPAHDVTVELTFRALTLDSDLLPRLLVADALPAADLARVRRRVARMRVVPVDPGGAAR
ncbi:MAG TPA: MOSC domain-containing protein [Actinophytocola sp.]|jgi:MOSC domain-containing protein YiiM|nr:MOSC domain-containing protein [Actinophytocola sp.]